MRFKWLNEYWTGRFTAAALIVMSLWLAATGKLALYIHPRYNWFTAIICGLALICLLADMACRPQTPKLMQPGRPFSAAAGLLCLAFCAVMLVLRPVGLTSAAASQRGVNAAVTTLGTGTDLADLSAAQADYSQFSIKEWASLLSQTNDAALFIGKPVSFSGFISPTPDNNPNVFYASRFVLTCCAVDARPVGVPVYMPGWQKEYKANQWLEIQGLFMQNPESSANPIVVNPQTVRTIPEPDEPYAY